jgi:hypothetical protein
MSWTPAVPPPPVEGAPTGTGLADWVTDTNGVGCTGGGDGEALAEALAELELGTRAVKKLPVGVAGVLPAAAAPLGAPQAVVVARMARAAQPAAVSRAPGRTPAMAVRALMEPPRTGAP